jgi:hypothetical protein
LMQVHGVAASVCDLDTVAGQVLCGARWLRAGFDACGDWLGAVAMYRTGRCDMGTVGAWSRIKLWTHLERQD